MRTLFLFLLLSHFCVAQRTILWEVTDTASGKRSIIVGTFHNIGNSFVDSIPLVKTALLQAELAIFESVDEERQLVDILNKREAQNQLEKLLPASDYATLKTLSKDWKTSLSILKPIEVLITLRREFQLSKCKTVKPTDTWDHLDNYLIDIARQHSIRLLGLETDSLQLNYLDELEKTWSEDQLRAELGFWIAKLTSEEAWHEECQETQQYLDLDIDYAFQEACDDDILITQRNDEWLPELTRLFTRYRCFVAVGLAHLKYSCGLLEELKRKGFIVKPMAIVPAGQ